MEGGHITSLELLDPFNGKDSDGDKPSLIDLKARDRARRQFYIEMQMLATGPFRERALQPLSLEALEGIWARLASNGK